MSTYRIQAGALLRLAAIAATSPEADPAEIIAIVQGAEPETLTGAIDGGETTVIHGGGITTDGISASQTAAPPVKPEE